MVLVLVVLVVVIVVVVIGIMTGDIDNDMHALCKDCFPKWYRVPKGRAGKFLRETEESTQ